MDIKLCFLILAGYFYFQYKFITKIYHEDMKEHKKRLADKHFDFF